MEIQQGTQFGTYRVIAPLGSGGMGEVWRAEDTSLGRQVALKVLPADFAEDQDRHARFEREARVLASLNHPNVATLFGLEHVGNQHILTMELVEGEGLDQLIARGRMSVDDAIPIAVQIAEALGAAHGQGIVHRDLKPANVMVRTDGTVKVLDFGLAKAWQNESDASSVSLSPTMTRHATLEGVILGTAAYMSPEQARGRQVDKRADIWAFGVVLWEMLTGKQLFAGETVSDILAAVLRAEPEMKDLPASTPVSVRRLLRRCLQRDPKSRLHDIADARIELSEVDEEPESPAEIIQQARPKKTLALLPWAVAFLAVGFATWTILGLSRGGDEVQKRVVAGIAPPPDTTFIVSSGLAISPEGSLVVFGAKNIEGIEQLWLHSLEKGSARPLSGTEKGKDPFWSPDSQSIGFFADERLRKLSLDSGVVETLAKARGRSGGTWNNNGVIVGTERGGVFQVQAGGGPVERISTGDESFSEYLYPSFLPDGVHFLYLARNYSGTSEKQELRVGSLHGRSHKVILSCNSNGVYASSGDLLWWQDGHLRAQPFDLENLELTGESRLVQPSVRFDPRVGLGLFSVASNGTLVFRSGGIVNGDELALVDRQGRNLGRVGDSGNFYHPRLSPDGSMVAVDRSDETNRGDIWIYDVERSFGTRLTSAPQDESVPVWSPDGHQLAFSSNRVNFEGAIHMRSLRGSDDERVVYELPATQISPWSWSSAGFIVVETNQESGRSNTDLAVFSTADDIYRPYLQTQFDEKHGAISPDGRFFAYSSNETGQVEIYVTTFPEPVDRWRVSTGGGVGPSWSRDGSELYFVKDQAELFAAAVKISDVGHTLEFGQPELLFEADFKKVARQTYDTADGQTFVINRRFGEHDATPLTLLLNAFSTKSD